MKHIKTPVRVDYVPHSWEPFATVFVVDAEGKEVLSEPVDTSYGVNPLEHPPAVEVTRAINTHDALVEALEHMIPRYCEMFKECGLGDPKMSAYVQAAQAALALAKGETE